MRILSLGEVMVEMSGAGNSLWRSGFAGDSFNMAWYLAGLRPGWQVSYGTRLGGDPLSEEAIAAAAAAGLGTGWITRDPDRSIGLYLISLNDGGERSFSYWRGESAARGLADDPDWLDAAFGAADVIYLSGITLAILPPHGRARVLARLAGRRVVFDPNIRPRLWEDAGTMRRVLTEAVSLAAISLPSFDDEAAAFGDQTPEATAARHAAAGAAEVVVKNGPGPLAVNGAAGPAEAPRPHPQTPVDTTGAGDSFNAGYLARRLAGATVTEAVAAGQMVAGAVIGHPGALVPRTVLARLADETHRRSHDS